MISSMLKELIQLGLKEREAKVYLATLKKGPCTAGPLVKVSGFHRVVVYGALERLKELRLISVVIKNNRQYFQATNPDHLLSSIEEKQRLAKRIIPDLKQMQSRDNTEMGVKILYGQEGFWDNLRAVIESAARFDHIMRIIGGAPDTEFYRAIGERYLSYTAFLRVNKVAKWLLSPEKYSEEFQRKFAKETTKNKLKTLPMGLSSPTYTRITPEMVTIEIYSTPLMIIQIKNKAVAKGYLEHFDLLWKLAS